MSAPSPGAPTAIAAFADLALRAELLKVLTEVGYESPSPIQAATIPPSAGRPRRARPGADRHRQDRRVRAADPVDAWIWRKSKPQALVLAPTRELAIQVAEAFQRYAAHCPASTCCRSTAARAYGPQLSGLQPRRACRGRHAGARDRSSRTRHAGPVAADYAGARRSRRNAAHGFHRRRRDGAEEDAADSARSRCSRRPCRRRSSASRRPICAIRSKSRSSRKTTTAANIRQRYWLRQRHAQARCADAHPRSRAVRRDAGVRAHQAGHRGTGRASLQARGFSAAAINGDMVQAQRERTIAATEGRQARYPGRHRRRRARPRRRAHQPRAQLRHPQRHRSLRASHRPHRPRRPQRRSDPVRGAARARHAARDRTRHAPADRADAAAERSRRSTTSASQVQGAHQRQRWRSRRPRPYSAG